MTTLRQHVWNSLPPSPPGILKTDIIAALAALDRKATIRGLGEALTKLRDSGSLRSDDGYARRYWRGHAVPPELPPRDLFDWTEAALDQVRVGWTAGKSGSVIAREIGGLSKSAVISMAHKIGLPARPSPLKTGSRPRNPLGLRMPPLVCQAGPSKPTHRRPPQPPAPPPAPTAGAEPYVFDRAYGRCQFMLTDRRPWWVCSSVAVAGESYCGEHRRRCCTRAFVPEVVEPGRGGFSFRSGG